VREVEHPKRYMYQHLREYSEMEFDQEQMGQDGCHLWETTFSISDWQAR